MPAVSRLRSPPAPEGDLWFTDQGTTPAIGRITPTGRITEFASGLRSGSVPFGITAGHHQQLWFTDHGCSGAGKCAIGRVSPDGMINETTAGLRRRSQPLGIAAGPAGEEWFADSSGAIGRIAASGRISERTRGLRPGSAPVAITAGPDGDMWFTDEGTSPAVGRITPAFQIREFSAGLQSGSEPAIISAAPDGELWFSDEGTNGAVGKSHSGAPAALKTPPSIAGAPRVGHPLRCRPAVWAAWAHLRPSLTMFAFDGYRWLRDGVAIAGRHAAQYAPVGSDRGHRLSCTETATYPAPFHLTAKATSRAVIVR